MIVSFALCAALVILAFVAFENYHNAMAGMLLLCSIVPSGFFLEARERYREKKNGGN